MANSIELTQPGHDFDPKKYSVIAQFVQEKDARHLLSLFEFCGNEKILDLGCGDGQITRFIARDKIPNGSIIGVDVSSSMIEFASTQNALKNTGFIVGNIESLESIGFEKNFDVIFSNHALHWIYGDSKQRKIINDMYNLLKSGGLVLVCLGTYGTFFELYEAAHSVLKGGEWKKYFDDQDLIPRWFPSESLYLNELRNFGFTQIRVETLQSWREFHDKAMFSDWIKTSLRTFMTKLQHANEQEKNKFVFQIVNSYIENLSGISDYPNLLSTEKIYLRDRVLYIKAIK